ncbi:hypothetical protein NEFER03_1488 [Nematocida sp. LUAm3]|nr:hypothetical protein NEFER03_1488 [Nematocida sp. LUAm3]KAI5174521.1 hypothetical protein NEFER02_0642 [Nematocida sp. LUAm2]KAI5178073.1 hypothetical protein NEFER01_1255 [Nematocida sp. LUAm1]
MDKKNSRKRKIALLTVLLCSIACFGTFIYYFYPTPPAPVENIQTTAMDRTLKEIREKLDSGIMKEAFFREIGGFDEFERAFAMAIITMKRNIHLSNCKVPFFTPKEYYRALKTQLFFISLYECFLLKISILESHFKVWKQMLVIVTKNSAGLSFKEKNRYQNELDIISKCFSSIEHILRNFNTCLEFPLFVSFCNKDIDMFEFKKKMYTYSRICLEKIEEDMCFDKWIKKDGTISLFSSYYGMPMELIEVFKPVARLAAEDPYLDIFLREDFRKLFKQKTLEYVICILNIRNFLSK